MSTFWFCINSALAPATIMGLGGGGVIWSKYCGFNHSPRKASTRIFDLRYRLWCPRARRARSCCRSCRGSAIGARPCDEDDELSIPRSRGDAECSCAGVRALPAAGPSLGSSNCAMPAEIATLVCRQRKNGEVCITTLCFFLLRRPPLLLPCSFSCSSAFCSRACSKLAMRTPSAWHWFHPPYVSGGS